MKNNKVGFLQEKNGNTSYMRVASFILLLFFIGYNFFYTTQAFKYGFKPILDINYIIYNMILLISIFIPKYLQKFVENDYIPKWMNSYANMRKKIKNTDETDKEQVDETK